MINIQILKKKEEEEMEISNIPIHYHFTKGLIFKLKKKKKRWKKKFQKFLIHYHFIE